MAAVDLSIIYRQYIDALNSRDIESLGSFVHQQAIHNGKEIGLEGYKSMIRDNISAIPDLQFNIETLVVSKDHVAARLVFRCTPMKEFLGLQPSCRQVEFNEHVFYRFEKDKIKQVWSLLDRETLRQQLEGAHS